MLTISGPLRALKPPFYVVMACLLLGASACAPDKRVDSDPENCPSPFSGNRVGEGIRPVLASSLLDESRNESYLLLQEARIWVDDRSGAVVRRMDIMAVPETPGSDLLSLTQNCANVETLDEKEWAGFRLQLPLKVNQQSGLSLNTMLLQVQGGKNFLNGNGSTMLAPEQSTLDLRSLAGEASSRIADVTDPIDTYDFFQETAEIYVIRGSGNVQRNEDFSNEKVLVQFEFRYQKAAVNTSPVLGVRGDRRE